MKPPKAVTAMVVNDWDDSRALEPVASIESVAEQLRYNGFVAGDVVVIITEAEYNRLLLAAADMEVIKAEAEVA